MTGDKRIQLLEFEKRIDDRTLKCQIELFDDGSVGLFGDDIDTWLFEFTDDALHRAIEKVSEKGYVPSRTEPNGNR